jgi:hypothetical protein
VLAAAGLGQVLQDVFTYTVSDINGATDQAELVIALDIATPFIPAPQGNFFDRDPNDRNANLRLPDPTPAIFITPVVEREARLLEVSTWGAGGSNLRLASVGEFTSDSLGAGLGLVPGQFVAQAVRESRLESDLDLLWILGRKGRTGLSADGLLSDPSLFTIDSAHLTQGPAQVEKPAEPRPARGFSAQLRNAANRLYPANREPRNPTN